ncbi:MAG: glycosyltransferase family 39 protein, partial [Anaerolineales bacterium]|nr:glycosyltransferase family 39 protein [Anaerolineales bacterium]
MSYVKKALARLGRLKLAQVLGTLIVLSGAALRLRQYFVNRSLWVDEASLALNIVERSFSSLFLPLDYDQGAPLGFLFIEKLLVSVFGNEDFILRLFPLFSGILALLLIHRIALNALGSFGLFSALLFSASHTMIYYSSELKQYSSDAMIGLLLVYLASLCMAEGARLRNIILLGFAGFISILVSHPSIFFLPAIGFLLVIQNWMERDFRKVRWLIGAGISWILVFLSTYLISLQYLAGNEYLQEYWGGHYASLPPWEHLDWYRRVALYLVPPVIPSYFPLFNLNLDQEILISSCLILFLIGILSLSKRNIKLAAL